MGLNLRSITVPTEGKQRRTKSEQSEKWGILKEASEKREIGREVYKV